MAQQSKAGDVAWWVAIAAGSILTFIPEPATTATGLAILTAALVVGND
jgi:hypothetical protein